MKNTASKFWMIGPCIWLLVFGWEATSAYSDAAINPKTGLPVGAADAISSTNDLGLTLQAILNSVRLSAGHAEEINSVACQYETQREELVAALMKILADKEVLQLNRGMAAYYLGEMRAVAAVDELAANISLKPELDPTSFYSGLPLVNGYTARDALVKIGTASIPAMIRNLAMSDDGQVRKLSLSVIVRIDDDRDISAFCLQKAIKAEADSQRQSRLKAALDALIADQ